MSTNPQPAPRKPSQHAGHGAKCVCGHFQTDHDTTCSIAECDCRAFRFRPCGRCGHAHSQHTVRCQDKGCRCRGYQEDNSPAAMLAMGVTAGQWQMTPVDRWKFLMRPAPEGEKNNNTVRVYACGMLHADGQRGRLAVKWAKNGNGKPIAQHLKPADIVDELNAMDPNGLGRMDKHIVRRELAKLEQQGAVRRGGKTRWNSHLFFYAKPLKSRSVTPEPDLEEAGLVVCTDHLNSASDSNKATSANDQILSIKKVLVKSFLRSLRADLASRPGLVVCTDHQELIDKTLDSVMEVVCTAYQNLLQVVCTSTPINKEVSSNSSSDVVPEQPPVPEPTPTTKQPAPPSKPPKQKDVPDQILAPKLAAYLAEFAGEPQDVEAVNQVFTACRQQWPEITDQEVAELAERKLRSRPRIDRSLIGFLTVALPKMTRIGTPPETPRPTPPPPPPPPRQETEQDWERLVRASLHDLERKTCGTEAKQEAQKTLQEAEKRFPDIVSRVKQTRVKSAH